MRKYYSHFLLLPGLALSLSACGAGTGGLSGRDATYTALVMTLSAPAAETVSVPSATPSSSPTLEASETLMPASGPSRTATRPAAPAGPLCDDSAYVSDVTIPDGTVMKPGEEFVKTWKIRNTGACSWTTAYTLAFLGGDRMDGVATALPAAVDPGGTIEISVGLVAPATAGTHTSKWRLKNADGNFFGEWVYVQIVVSGVATAIGPTPTPAPAISDTPVPTNTETPAS